MKAKDLLVEFYNPADDAAGIRHFSDTRRPRLTMVHLQKLRKSKDASRYEDAKKVEFLPTMYNIQPDMGGI